MRTREGKMETEGGREPENQALSDGEGGGRGRGEKRGGEEQGGEKREQKEKQWLATADADAKMMIKTMMMKEVLLRDPRFQPAQTSGDGPSLPVLPAGTHLPLHPQLPRQKGKKGHGDPSGNGEFWFKGGCSAESLPRGGEGF